MKTIRSLVALRRWRESAVGRIVLVPTMGALHHGHSTLIRRARRLAGSRGKVVVTIFVNPTQFGPREDFASYPRPLARDVALCAANGADVVFHPSAEAVYCSDSSVWVDEDVLSQTLCGKSRPGHFRGVCTVVAKLFLLVQPSDAVFGEKDWQQLAILRRMVRDLNFPIRVVGHPTVREPDGLATSSRNAYLTAEERREAARIFQELRSASSRPGRPGEVTRSASAGIAKIPGARIDYVEAVDAATLEPLKNRRTPGRLAAAVFLGRARLIDNVSLPVVP